MTNRYWFRPKTVGYGATPTTWEGWLLTAGSCGVIGVATVLLVMARKLPDLPMWLAVTGWFLWVAVVSGTCVVMLVVSRRRTDGEWRWRWRWGSRRPLRGE
jgi:hypothetical protein